MKCSLFVKLLIGWCLLMVVIFLKLFCWLSFLFICSMFVCGVFCRRCWICCIRRVLSDVDV